MLRVSSRTKNVKRDCIKLVQHFPLKLKPMENNEMARKKRLAATCVDCDQPDRRGGGRGFECVIKTRVGKNDRSAI